MKILICGALGKMGQKVVSACENDEEFEVEALVDLNFADEKSVDKYANYSCYSSIQDVEEPCDCVIDFSNHASIFEISRWCKKYNIPVVLATTGYDDSEMKKSKT